jgi:hypothetical protein
MVSIRVLSLGDWGVDGIERIDEIEGIDGD